MNSKSEYVRQDVIVWITIIALFSLVTIFSFTFQNIRQERAARAGATPEADHVLHQPGNTVVVSH